MNIIRRCATLFVVYAHFLDLSAAWEPCTQNSDCTAETCWDDVNSVDDGNKASDYRYFCRGGDGVCVYFYTDNPATPTVCQKDRSFAGKNVRPCTENEDCTPETCWNDVNVIDDNNDARKDYSYYCRFEDGVCETRYIGAWYKPIGSRTVCQKYSSSSSFEGDAVVSGPSDTVNSAGKLSEVGGVAMLMAMLILF